MATQADGDTPNQAVPDQPFAQTSDQTVFSLAVAQSTVTSTFPNTTNASPTVPDKAASRDRADRLPPAEEARRNRASQAESKTPVAPGPDPKAAVPQVASATMVSPVVPIVPTVTSNASSQQPTSAAGPVNKVARRTSEFTGGRADGLSSEEPAAEGSVAPAAVPNSSATSAVQAIPEALAFAVKLQPASTAPLPSRVSAGLGTSSGQPASDNSSVTGADDASSQAHAARQKPGSDADQGGSLAEDTAPKDAEKSKANGEVPTQNTSMSDASMPIRTGSGTLEAPSQPAAEPAQSGSRSSDPPAPTAELPSVFETTQPQGPMKEISMRIEAAGGQNVDVRIVQRAGDLQIAVKSGDDVTTQGLRHGLADLANRLNETGYHAETWRPGQQAAPESTSPGNPSHQSQSDGSQSNSGGPQQDRGQRHNNPSNRPHWIEELESNLSSGTEPTGQFNGIVSQPTI